MERDSVMQRGSFIKKKGSTFWNNNPCDGEVWTQKEPWIEKEFSSCLFKNKVILDAGCGGGELLIKIAKDATKAYGIDMSVMSLKETREKAKKKKIKNVRLTLGDVEKLPFPDETFDSILCFGVLHHSPDIKRGISETYRVLKKGGEIKYMLYKKYNPTWLGVVLLRGLSKIFDKITGVEFFLYNKMMKKEKSSLAENHGSAVQELLGVPILKMYDEGEIRALTRQYKRVTIRNYHAGFFHFYMTFLRSFNSKFIEKLFISLEQKTHSFWSFYCIIDCEK